MIGIYVWTQIPHGSTSPSIFNGKALLFTLLVTYSFILRNSSAIGFIPLILHKAFYEKNFKMFALSGIIVALPLLFITVLADSLYYGKLTITSWNFIKFNVIEEGGDIFGVNAWHDYLKSFMVEYLKQLTLLYIPAFFIYTYKQIKKGIFPELSLIISFYLFVLSRVSHKEARFMVPIIPLILLQISLCISSLYNVLSIKFFKGIMIYTVALHLLTLGHSFGKGKGYLATDFILSID